MIKLNRRSISLVILLLALRSACTSAHADEGVVIEASEIEGRKAYLYDRDNIMLVVSGKGAEASTQLPKGRHRVTAWLRYNGKGDAYRQTVFHLSCGGASSGQTVDALSAGHPLELIFVNHAARPVDISISGGTPTPEGRREFMILQADTGSADIESGFGSYDEDVSDFDDALDDLAAFDAAATSVPVVLLEKVKIARISGPVIVSRINSDRITYSPGGRGMLAFTLENLDDAEIEAGVRVEMVQGIDERTLLLSERVTLPPAGSVEKEAAFLVGDKLWGRGFEVRVETAGGSDLATHAVSVITNPWQVAMHGRGTPMRGSERWNREEALHEARSLARSNMAGYNNIYEAFAWAPCDFSSMTPEDDEPFYSGQTQYYNRRSDLQYMHKVFEEHGIFSITYGKSCAAGLPGLEYAHTHPEQMNVFGIAGFAHEDISVDVIDRMVEGRYRRHGRHEDFWQRWISCWTHFGNHAATNAGCDEIAASAKLLGWHGVRYDGHFSVWRDPVGTARLIKYAEDRIAEQVPDFVFGYNHCGPRHNSPDGAFSDIEMAAQAHGGGMVMSEYYRELNGNVATNIRHLQAAGDMVRLHGGYFLTIFDDASAWNAALIMAGGARLMGGGGLRKYATRFSAFILDPEMRRLQAPEKIIAPVQETPFLWQSFIYEKQTGLQDAVLIMQLVNVSENFDFAGKHRPPLNVNPPQKNVQFDLDLPAGYEAVSVFATEDYDTFLPMDARFDGTRLTIPSVRLWTTAIVRLKKQYPPQALHEICAVPVEFSKSWIDGWSFEEDDAGQGEFAIDGTIGPDEIRAINSSRVMITPKVLEAVLRMGPPPDTAPGDSLYEPADFRKHDAGVDAEFRQDEREPIELRRDGKPDIHYARGVFYHLNRLYESFAEIEGAEITTSSMDGGRTACAAALSPDNKPAMTGWLSRQELTNCDIIILDNIPMGGLTLQQRRDIFDFVEAGGSLLVLGGWYALSKGAYEGSFVEDFLPVRCRQSTYLLRLKAEDGVIEASPEYEAVTGSHPTDFATHASIEWANHVQPREGAQTLLHAGGVPLLVYGEFGSGRVAVWAGSCSGQPEDPYWQGETFPQVMTHVLEHLAQLARETVEDRFDARLAAQVVRAKEALEDAELMGEFLGGGDAQDDLAKNLRMVLQSVDNRDILFAARFLLVNREKFNPQDFAAFTDKVVPHIQRTLGWSNLGKQFINQPPLMLERLVAEISAGSVDDISFRTIMTWRNIDEITRLRCIAAAADPDALPYLRELNAKLDAQEAQWQQRLDAGAGSDNVTDMYKTRLLRPFVTYAMMQCGGRDRQTLYQFSKGCLDLPYYAWRQHWILESAYEGLRGAHQRGNPDETEMYRMRIEHCSRVIKQLNHAMRLVSPLFTPETIGMDETGIEASRQAIREADCHRSLPLCLDFIKRVEPEILAELGELDDASLPSVKHFYRSLLQRYGF